MHSLACRGASRSSQRYSTNCEIGLLGVCFRNSIARTSVAKLATERWARQAAGDPLHLGLFEASRGGIPPDAAQPLGHSATMARVLTPMATVVRCQRWVYARPR